MASIMSWAELSCHVRFSSESVPETSSSEAAMASIMSSAELGYRVRFFKDEASPNLFQQGRHGE